MAANVVPLEPYATVFAGRRTLNRVMLWLMLGASLSLMHPMEAIGQPSTKTIQANGVELHYVEKGTGVAVIFIHGGLDDYRAWDEQVGPFSDHYRAIAYSRRYNHPNSGVTFGSSYSAEVVHNAKRVVTWITLELGVLLSRGGAACDSSGHRGCVWQHWG